jgi:hypothetical protein
LNVAAGKLRALAISSKARSSVLPDTPTIAESGYNDFETTAWWGVFAPAGLPDALAATLAGEIEAIRHQRFLPPPTGAIGRSALRSHPSGIFQISTQRTDKMGRGRA